jgi:hypothetical protein
MWSTGVLLLRSASLVVQEMCSDNKILVCYGIKLFARIDDVRTSKSNWLPVRGREMGLPSRMWVNTNENFKLVHTPSTWFCDFIYLISLYDANSIPVARLLRLNLSRIYRLLSNGYRGSFLWVKLLKNEADHSNPSTAEVKKDWRHTSTHPTRLNGVYRDQFDLQFITFKYVTSPI